MQAVRIGTRSPGHRAMPPPASQPTAAASRLVVRRRHTLCCVCHVRVNMSLAMHSPLCLPRVLCCKVWRRVTQGRVRLFLLTSAGWPAATADAAAGTCGDGVCVWGGGVLVAHVCVSLSLVVGHAQLRAARTALQQAAVTAARCRLPLVGWLVWGNNNGNSHGRAVSSWRPGLGPPRVTWTLPSSVTCFHNTTEGVFEFSF
jgi:hypothetical protein